LMRTGLAPRYLARSIASTGGLGEENEGALTRSLCLVPYWFQIAVRAGPTGVCATGHDPSGKGGLMVRRRLVSAWLVVLALIPAPWTLPCGVERWSVKTGTDADSGLVDVASSTSNTISTMRGWTAPNPIPANNRVSPYET